MLELVAGDASHAAGSRCTSWRQIHKPSIVKPAKSSYAILTILPPFFELPPLHTLPGDWISAILVHEISFSNLIFSSYPPIARKRPEGCQATLRIPRPDILEEESSVWDTRRRPSGVRTCRAYLCTRGRESAKARRRERRDVLRENSPRSLYTARKATTRDQTRLS
jgi:hypothetical protein